MKIVHLAQDEKFLPLARSLFEEAFPGGNTYLVCRRRGHTPRFLLPGPSVRYRHRLAFTLPLWLPELRAADLVVLHSMTRAHAQALRGVPASATVVWIGYGYDYYGLLPAPAGGYLGERTRALLAELALREDRATHSRPWVAGVAARIDAFSVNPTEVAGLRAALPRLRGVHHVLPSFTVEDVFAQGTPGMRGPDILLGNSAAPSNNHLEALDLLHGTLPAQARVIAPLNYGDARYADRVAQHGRALFGERFVALRDWLPLADYQARIAGCGVVLMNHRRQQAVGNLSAALYNGAKVFLPRANPLFEFFTDLGAVVHAVEAIGSDPMTLQQPPGAAERAANRAAIVRRYGRDSVLARVRGLQDLHEQRHEHRHEQRHAAAGQTGAEPASFGTGVRCGAAQPPSPRPGDSR